MGHWLRYELKEAADLRGWLGSVEDLKFDLQRLNLLGRQPQSDPVSAFTVGEESQKQGPSHKESGDIWAQFNSLHLLRSHDEIGKEQRISI